MRPNRSCFQNEQAGGGSPSLHIYEWFGERRPSVSTLPFPSSPLLMGLLYLQDPSVNETGRKLTRADKSRLQHFHRCTGTLLHPFSALSFFFCISVDNPRLILIHQLLCDGDLPSVLEQISAVVYRWLWQNFCCKAIKSWISNILPIPPKASQVCMLHRASSVCKPMQMSPPWAGAGLPQVLVRW